jgi:transcriptional regulator with XRE-family HTH domain
MSSKALDPEALRSARRRRGWSRHDLSVASGFSYPMLAKWECGYSDPSLRNVARLADSLGITVDDLLGEREALDASR